MSAPAAPAARLDLRGESCPMTFVRTQLALEGLARGAVLEVLLDPGEPADSVPRSVRLDGHAVVAAEAQSDGTLRLHVRRA